LLFSASEQSTSSSEGRSGGLQLVYDRQAVLRAQAAEEFARINSWRVSEPFLPWGALRQTLGRHAGKPDQWDAIRFPSLLPRTSLFSQEIQRNWMRLPGEKADDTGEQRIKIGSNQKGHITLKTGGRGGEGNPLGHNMNKRPNRRQPHSKPRKRCGVPCGRQDTQSACQSRHLRIGLASPAFA
jgi:hypothetical protein